MANFNVSVDMTLCKMVSVEAENEQEAMDKVNEMIANNPYQYTNNYSHYVTHSVVDAEPDNY